MLDIYARMVYTQREERGAESVERAVKIKVPTLEPLGGGDANPRGVAE